MTLASRSDVDAFASRGVGAVLPQATPYAMLSAAAALSPRAAALRQVGAGGSSSEELSFAELLARIRAAAALFRDLEGGRPIALITGNTISGQIALWGAELAGMACPINPMLRPDHVAALLVAGGARAAVVTGRNHETDIWERLVPGLRAQGVSIPILHCDADRACAGSDGCFEEMIGAADGRDHPAMADPQPDDIAAIYHTGGTTGVPKLVRHSHRNQAHVARSCALLHDLGPDDIVLNGFPLFHVAGAFVYGLSTLSAGGTLLLPGRLGMRNRAFMSNLWQEVERHRITVLGVVPTIMSGLLAQPVDADISSLRWALSGGSPLPPDLADAFERHTGVPVRNIFGMTEAAGCIATEPVHGPRTPLSCGLPLPLSEVRVVAPGDPPDPDAMRSTGETGIILARGPNVSPGYTDAARDAGTFLPGGWLVTGDLGHLDTEGRLFISGRAKDVIIRGSHNIDPQSIEDLLIGHPDVEVVAAVGMPDAYAGELPVAFVTLRAGATVDGADLIEHLKPRIGEPAALPKRIGVLEAMPLTAVGKIFKPALRQIALRWAVEAAIGNAGISSDDADIDIGEDGARVVVPASRLAALRAALTGMPAPVTLVESGAP